MFRFYLDDVLVSDPVNWADFTETLEHDDIIKGILPKYENQLKFTGGGYDYIYKQYASFGYCSHIALKVQYSCDQRNFTTKLEGIIFIKDCKFNTNKCEVECEVEDNNYGARIYNNKSIKVFVDAELTKNGLPLTPASYHVVTFFRPVDGVYLIDEPRDTYPIYDCFRFLIDFMTDKLVGFESSYLQSGELSQIDITTGGLIRKPDDLVMPPEVPLISFEMLFTEVNKKFPIAFTVVDRAGKPTIKIENEDYFYANNASGAILKNIEDLYQYFNNEVLYSSVKFGGPSVAVDLTIHHFTYDKFRSFKEEEYFFTGECNIDKVLDLYGEWISDSNIIEELFITNTTNDQYDTDIFFIQQTFQNAKQQPNPLTLEDPFYYNPALTNDRVSVRHKAIELVLQDNVLGFRAALGADQGSFFLYNPPPYGTSVHSGDIQIRFDQDSSLPNYDTSNSYDTSTWRYTASVLGEYTFECGMSVIKDDPNALEDSGQEAQVHMVFEQYSPANVLIQKVDNLVAILRVDGNFPMKSAATLQMSVGDYVIVKYYHIHSRIHPTDASWFTVIIGHGSWFRNISTPTSAVRPTYGINNPYLASTLEFEYPISDEQYALIREDLSRSIIVNNGDGRNRECWIRKISRNYSTSMAKVELITDIIII